MLSLAKRSDGRAIISFSREDLSFRCIKKGKTVRKNALVFLLCKEMQKRLTLKQKNYDTH
jgi:hypothetical protein